MKPLFIPLGVERLCTSIPFTSKQCPFQKIGFHVNCFRLSSAIWTFLFLYREGVDISFLPSYSLFKCIAVPFIFSPFSGSAHLYVVDILKSVSLFSFPLLLATSNLTFPRNNLLYENGTMQLIVLLSSYCSRH